MTMDTKALLAEAEALKPQLLTDRRTLHRDPEVGPSLPRTAAYVTERLTALGYTPRPLAGGVVADITGEDTGRCVLLRADMDALRVREATGLDFQSENGAMHATKKYRGKIDNAIMSYVKDMEADLKAARPERVFITHSGCSREVVEEVRSYLKGLTVFCEILETRAGGVISSHCGPGTLGVLFIAK